MRLFSKPFLRLSQIDQAAVINARIEELEEGVNRGINSHDRQKARQQIIRIERRAVEFGVWDQQLASGGN